MYGLLAGCGQTLRGEARGVWQRHLCGLCESLSRAIGPPARLLTTPDAAFLSLMLEAQAPCMPKATSPSRCLGRRPFHLSVPSTRSRGSRFARSLAAAAAVARLEDAARDGDLGPRWLARIGAALLGPAVRGADSDLRDLGFDPSILTQAQQDAARLEKARPDFGALAAPTEKAYAAVFGHTAVLAGQPAHTAAAQGVGRWFGRLAYVEDARSDHTRDVARRRFNALAACFGAHALQRGASLAAEAAERLRRAVGGLRVARHRDVLTQLSSAGLRRGVAWACGRRDGAERIRVGRKEGPARRLRPRRWRPPYVEMWDEESSSCCLLPCCCCDPCCWCTLPWCW